MKNKLNQYIHIICSNFKLTFKFKLIIEKLNYKIIEVIKNYNYGTCYHNHSVKKENKTLKTY